jgi:uridine kinase
MTNARSAMISTTADDILALPATGFRRVAIDGVDGAGKTHFGDELATELTSRGVPVIRASVDGFHHPAAHRYRKGRRSPEGYFLDSYDYDRLVALLLAPLGPDGSGEYVRQVHDVHAERPVEAVVERAEPGSVLVLDGIFVHRDELIGCWDYSIWLDVPFEVSVPRGAARGYGDPDPKADSNHRYIEGQRLYLTKCRPQQRATIRIDNTDLNHPTVTRNRP